MAQIRLSLVVATVLLAAGTGAANARVDCVEAVTGAVLHVNGNIYFTTDKTCPNWCQVNWGSSAANKNAFAMLLAAKTSARQITFDWPYLASCTEINTGGASPDYMILN